MPRIITIAREYGSGGRLIAQKVAQKVGLVYYDNEVRLGSSRNGNGC